MLVSAEEDTFYKAISGLSGKFSFFWIDNELSVKLENVVSILANFD